MDLYKKAAALRALHDKTDIFVIANAWDVGSAKILVACGFKAIATTGAGLAYSRGRPNGAVGRAEIMQNAEDIARSVDIPVSADLENGFGLSAEEAAQTISDAIERGVAGGSIEDTTYSDDPPVIDALQASERIAACAEVIKSSGVPFQLVARADNFLLGREDLAKTIERLQAYQESGADVLYAPGLRTREEIRAVVSSVDRPVNVVMGLVGADFSLQDLEKMGVARVSVGSAIQRMTFGALDRAARELLTDGTFTFAKEALSVEELDLRFSNSTGVG